MINSHRTFTSKWIHLKTGKVYTRIEFLGEISKQIEYITNCTNAQDGEEVILYSNDEGMLFVREASEFYSKFSQIYEDKSRQSPFFD